LGVAITTPACVAIFRTRFSNILASKANWLYVLLLVALTPVVFAQSSAPVAFILYPLLLLILLRIGMGWAAMATLFVATVSGWFTFRGQGPFALSVSLSPIAPSIILQLYIMAAIFMLYSASVVLESQEATERQLRRIVSLHALITANSRDAIILADLKGNRRYVSSASQTLGGWTPNDLIRQGSFDLIHPEDRPRAEATAKGLTSAGDSASMEIRVRKRSGDYIWMESSLRVARDPETGTPYGILNMMRDISERKQAEQQLEEAYHAVEALAITDALTGLANRRRFDSCLTNEWRRGMRDRTPLSLLLIDVDLFKSYNDSYGHLRGDSCLKQVAESAQDVVMRPGDLVARFGGEEFAVILPGTCNEGATRIANNICEALHDRKVAHKENPFGIVTISVGCATMTPQLGHNSATLIELADEALYRSKRNGRNQVSSSQDINCTENESTGGVLSGAVAHKPA
jgi:diguanylate cyclase (GGDEF)-like protein/PAS domain S-box-containing protein